MLADVRFGSLADICGAKGHVRFAPNSDRESRFPRKVMSAYPQKRTCAVQPLNVRDGPKADILNTTAMSDNPRAPGAEISFLRDVLPVS
jgi:hypothetical protein